MYILFVFAIVAGGGSSRFYEEWVNLAEFTSQARCDQAAKAMGIKSDKFICLPK